MTVRQWLQALPRPIRVTLSRLIADPPPDDLYLFDREQYLDWLDD